MRPVRLSAAAIELGLVFLHQVGSLHVVIQGTGLELADPDPDKLPRYVVLLGQRVQRLACDELLGDLPFKHGAVGSVFGHGFHPPEARQRGSIEIAQSVYPQGRTPKKPKA